MTPLVLNAELGVEGLHHNNNVRTRTSAFDPNGAMQEPSIAVPYCKGSHWRNDCDASAPDLLVFLSIHLFDFAFIFYLIIIYSCAT